MTESTTSLREVGSLVPLEHDEAMALAAVETQRVLDLAGSLTPSEWSADTACAGWTVQDTLAHLLGMWKLQADRAELARQQTAAAAAAQASGRLRIDELTALQVTEHAGLTPVQLLRQLEQVAPRALAARAALPPEVRAQPYDAQMPGEAPWTLGYLFDVISTRDPWMHRVDISQAIGRAVVLTEEHDARLVEDAVAEWARRHGQPFSLVLTGPAGGSFRSGQAGPELTLDAVEFCQILSGRGQGSGLLATSVPF